MRGVERDAVDDAVVVPPLYADETATSVSTVTEISNCDEGDDASRPVLLHDGAAVCMLLEIMPNALYLMSLLLLLPCAVGSRCTVRHCDIDDDRLA